MTAETPAPAERPAAARTSPLLTSATARALHDAQRRGGTQCTASFDLGRSQEAVPLDGERWQWRDAWFPLPPPLKERTVYWWDGDAFAAVARYSGSLIKLVPTSWGPPTFEIDGIKMLVTAQASPLEDARRKVALVQPAGKVVLDTCGGLGYFAASCLDAGVAQVTSFEKNADVLWLRTLNPWSPQPQESSGRLVLTHAPIDAAIAQLADASFDAILHDPPRFGIAGELYSLAFYRQLARVLRRGGLLFHYTGMPNRLTSGRNVPREVVARLEQAGFRAEPALDGVLARRV